MKLKSPIHLPVLTPPVRLEGFSLIELMVAMTIGLFLMAGLFYVYIGASQSSRLQGALALMQGNARYAFEIMGVDIRMTGFTGSQNLSNVVGTPSPATLSSLIDLSNPLLGYENTNPPNVCTTANTSPCYLANTDSLTVVRVDTETKYTLDPTVWPLVAGSFTLSTSTWPATWSTSSPAGEIFVAADYTGTTVFQVESINSGARTVSYAAGGTASPGNLSGATLGPFSGGVNALALYRLSGVSYYIGRNPAGEPALYRDKLGHNGTTVDSKPEELVQGVENMQITYGVDTDATTDGNVNGYWTATQVNAGTDGTLTMPAGTASDHWKRVLSVRITLSLVSGQNEKVGSTGDRLLRKTLTNTIAIRNRLP